MSKPKTRRKPKTRCKTDGCQMRNAGQSLVDMLNTCSDRCDLEYLAASDVVMTLRCAEGAHENCRGNLPATTGYPVICACPCHVETRGVTDSE